MWGRAGRGMLGGSWRGRGAAPGAVARDNGAAPDAAARDGGAAPDAAVPDGGECWICQEGGSRSSELIAPCECKGSMKWVHRHCLDRWRSTAPSAQAFTTCRHCAFRYVLRQVTSGGKHKEAAEARARILRMALLHFLLANFALQAWLVGLALLLGRVDDGAPLPFWRYYVWALVMTSAVFGVWLTTLTCIRLCRRESHSPYTPYSHCDCNFYWWSPWCECPMCPSIRHPDWTCPGCEGEGICASMRESQANCNCTGDGGGDGGEICCLLCCPFIILILAILGMFYACVALVVWVQGVVRRYLQTIELRELTHEWVVQDLASQEYQRSLEEGHVTVVPASLAPAQGAMVGSTVVGAPSQMQMRAQVQEARPELRPGESQLLRNLSAIFARNPQRNPAAAAQPPLWRYDAATSGALVRPSGPSAGAFGFLSPTRSPGAGPSAPSAGPGPGPQGAGGGAIGPSAQGGAWNCSACTFRNTGGATCSVCSAARPAAA